MSTIAQLVAHIQAAPAPVVFLDSCAILDVARAPRDHPDSVKAASDLIQLLKRIPRAVHLLVSDIVQKEWDDNIASVNSSADREIEKPALPTIRSFALPQRPESSLTRHHSSDSPL
jgi:hypothetical protein